MKRTNLILTPLLALMWGIAWAVALQRSTLGRYLAARRTWLTVVIGVGGDLLLLHPLLGLTAWLKVCSVIAASSVGIVARSLVNEWRDNQELLAHARKGGLA